MATEIIKKSMYKGSVNIDFYPNSHMYKFINEDGTKENLLSVSAISGNTKQGWMQRWVISTAREAMVEYDKETKISVLRKEFYDEDGIILSEGLIARKIYEDCAASSVRSKEATDIGSAVHDWCEKYAISMISGKESPKMLEGEKEQNGCNAFLDWVMDNDVEFIELECFIYSKKHKYVGTFDVLFKMNGKDDLYLGDYKTSKAFYAFDHSQQLNGYRIAFEEEFPDKKIKGMRCIRFDKETGEVEVHTVSKDNEFLSQLKVTKYQKKLEKKYRKK